MANKKVDKSTINFAFEAGTNNVVVATWSFKVDYDTSVSPRTPTTENYRVRWWYKTRNGDLSYLLGTETTVDVFIRQSKYTIPDNAIGIKFQILPVSKTHTVNKKEVYYYTAEQTEVTWAIPGAIVHTPATPSAPSVAVNGYTLTASIETYDANSKWIEFAVIKNNSTRVASGFVQVRTNYASYSCAIDPGNNYKVHCRAYYYTGSGPISSAVATISDQLSVSDWSEYSSTATSVPGAPEILRIKTLNMTTAQVHWSTVRSATSYEVEYTTSAGYFDSAPSEVQSVTVTGVTHAEITGLESGRRWVFRVRAVNETGNSGWSNVAERILGHHPSAPTTWAESTTVIIPNYARLYWAHNSVDGSDQTAAQMEITINGTTTTENFTTATSHGINTSQYAEGATIKWRVRTKGAINEWSPWSALRSITLYAQPGIQFTIPSTVTSFPITIEAEATPGSQKLISYDISIVSNTTYTDIDTTGRTIRVARGQEIFHKFYTHNDQYNFINQMLTAFDVNLKNDQSYTMTIKASMSSGLTAEASQVFLVTYAETDLIISAEIAIDTDDFIAYIRPYAERDIEEEPDENENEYTPTPLMSEMAREYLLSVYRRDYDGGFTLIAENLPNDATTVTDMHPALDFARYRVVATNQVNGDMDFSDIPAIPINATCIVLQWDDEWYPFDSSESAPFEEPVVSGSRLILPANVDIQDRYNHDVSLVNYIGRSHPVSYYGTQKGTSSSWSCDIDIRDRERLFQLRRLAAYPGDVYVREPSGAGYLAHVTVSFSKKHKDTVIPVTLGITRVDGSE